MPTELKVPEVGESVTEVEIGRWLVKEGDAITVDQPLVELETDKVNQELPAPFSGALVKILMQAGDTASVGDVIAHIEEGASGSSPSDKPDAKPAEEATKQSKEAPKEEQPHADAQRSEASGTEKIMPAAQLLLDQHGLKASDVTATGPGGRLLKEDVLKTSQAMATRPSRLNSQAPKLSPAKRLVPSPHPPRPQSANATKKSSR